MHQLSSPQGVPSAQGMCWVLHPCSFSSGREHHSLVHGGMYPQMVDPGPNTSSHCLFSSNISPAYFVPFFFFSSISSCGLDEGANKQSPNPLLETYQQNYKQNIENHLLQEVSDIMATASWPLPRIRIMIQGIWHHKGCCVRINKIPALLIIIMWHIQPGKEKMMKRYQT